MASAADSRKTPRSMKDHLHVWERGTDMVLAAHYTRVKCGVTSTVEIVHFERPERVNFRLVRGPVPHVRESFVLAATERGSTAAPMWARCAAEHPSWDRGTGISWEEMRASR